MIFVAREGGFFTGFGDSNHSHSMSEIAGWPCMSGSGHSGNEQESASLLLHLRRIGTITVYVAGAELFREGSVAPAVYLVEEGTIEVTIASGERRMQVGSAGAGHLLALASVIRNGPLECSATAKTDCKLVVVGAEAMRAFLKHHPELCLQTVQFLGSEILDLSSKVIRPLRLQPRYPKNPY